MPTSYAVLDSGILLATVQTETYTEHAKTLIARLAQQQVQMIAPVLLRYELVAVAERYQADFWTADERLFNAVDGKFPGVYWLGNVKLEA